MRIKIVVIGKTYCTYTVRYFLMILITESVKKNSRDVKERIIEDYIKVWLKHAPQRENAENKRTRKRFIDEGDPAISIQ